MITSFQSKVLFNLFMIHDPHHWSKIPSKTISRARLFYRLDNFHVNNHSRLNQPTNHIHPPTHTHHCNGSKMAIFPDKPRLPVAPDNKDAMPVPIQES